MDVYRSDLQRHPSMGSTVKGGKTYRSLKVDTPLSPASVVQCHDGIGRERVVTHPRNGISTPSFGQGSRRLKNGPVSLYFK